MSSRMSPYHMVEHFIKILLCIQRLVHTINFNEDGGLALSAFL